MGMPALKQVIEEIREAVETAGHHLKVTLPTLMAKQKDSMKSILDAIDDTDMDAAVEASIKSVKKGLKPSDLLDSKTVTKAGDKAFKEGVGDGVVDLLADGAKALYLLDHDQLKVLAKEALGNIKDPENLTKLARSYVLAAKSKGADALATTALTSVLYDSYLDTVAGTPAEDSAFTEKEFEKIVKQGYSLGKSGHKLGKDMDSGAAFQPNLMD